MSSRERREEDLATLVAELRDTLDELQGTVEPDRRQPPGPRELLRFTESYTIPTLLSILEASIRALELLQATLRLVDGRPLDTERRRGTDDAAARVGSLGRTTVDRVDSALSELTAALEGEPPEGEARDLLAEARALREEVDDRIRTAEANSRRDRRTGAAATGHRDERRTGAHDIPVVAEGDPSPDTEDIDAPTTDGATAMDTEARTVDVDAELESIKEAVEDERERSAAWQPDGSPAEDGRSEEAKTESASEAEDADADGSDAETSGAASEDETGGTADDPRE